MEDNFEIVLDLNSKNEGGFYVEKDGQRLAEMKIVIGNGTLIVLHTEVSEELKGFNMGKRLLNEMVAYARKNNLKVRPICPFVNAQFRRHPEEYADIWLNSPVK